MRTTSQETSHCQCVSASHHFATLRTKTMMMFLFFFCFSFLCLASIPQTECDYIDDDSNDADEIFRVTANYVGEFVVRAFQPHIDSNCIRCAEYSYKSLLAGRIIFHFGFKTLYNNNNQHNNSRYTLYLHTSPTCTIQSVSPLL